MNLPEKFRYRRSLEQFKQVVDIAKSMMEDHLLYLLFGNEEDVCFHLVCGAEEAQQYMGSVPLATFQSIMDEEVLFLVSRKVRGADSGFRTLNRYLKQEGVPPEDWDEIIEMVKEKSSYAGAQLVGDDCINRFHFKEKTTAPKLLAFDWDINKYLFADNTEQIYAQFRIQTAQTLPSEIISERAAEEPAAVSFVCDSHDLRAMIAHLHTVLAILEEYET